MSLNHFIWPVVSLLVLWIPWISSECISLDSSKICKGMASYGIDSDYLPLLSQIQTQLPMSPTLSSHLPSSLKTIEDVDSMLSAVLSHLQLETWLPGCSSIELRSLAYLNAFLCSWFSQLSKSCLITPPALCLKSSKQLFLSLGHQLNSPGACSSVINKEALAKELDYKFSEFIIRSMQPNEMGAPAFEGKEGECLDGDVIQGTHLCGYATNELACSFNCTSAVCPSTQKASLRTPSSPFSSSKTLKKNTKSKPTPTIGVIVGSVSAGTLILALLSYLAIQRYRSKSSQEINPSHVLATSTLTTKDLEKGSKSQAIAQPQVAGEFPSRRQSLHAASFPIETLESSTLAPSLPELQTSSPPPPLSTSTTTTTTPPPQHFTTTLTPPSTSDPSTTLHTPPNALKRQTKALLNASKRSTSLFDASLTSSLIFSTLPHSNSTPPPPTTTTSSSTPTSSSHSPSSDVSYFKHFQRGDICIVEEEFEPQAEDELPLKIGESVELISVFDDGWALAKLLHSVPLKQGMIPLPAVAKKEK